MEKTKILLNQLVLYNNNNNNNNKNKNEYNSNEELLQYLMRLLNAGLKPTVIQDEFYLGQVVKKKLINEKREEDATEFAELYRKLMSKNSLNHSWSIVYLLYSLSRPKTTTTSSARSSNSNANSDVYLSLPLHYLSSSSSSSSSSIPRQPAITPLIKPSSVTTPISNESQMAKAYEEYEKLIAKSMELSEYDILRDVVYCFHGIEGKYIQYDPKLSSTHGLFIVSPSVVLPRSIRDLVRKLCELGWIYRKLHNYVEAKLKDKYAGLVSQSFCYAIKNELNEYYRVIAILEAQLNMQESSSLSSNNNNNNNNNNNSNNNNTKSLLARGPLTLRRLFVWMQEPLQRLKLLSLLVDKVGDTSRGGAMVSAIHLLSKHGDPKIQESVTVIVTKISKIIFGMMRKWMTEGILEDPYGEFFVQENPNTPQSLTWQEKYKLKEDMLPSFISHDQAKKILLIGKSINFMKNNCNDTTEWMSGIAIAVEKIQSSSSSNRKIITDSKNNNIDEYYYNNSASYDWEIDLCLGEKTNLDTFCDCVAEYANRSLVKILFDKFKLSLHLSAIKKYLLLGQGDTTEVLMERLSDDLDQPASKILRNNLVSILDGALRSSLAQYDLPDVLNRLDVRLLDYSEGDTGWDIFSLDYRVDAPINAIFTESVMKNYLQIFNFLWRLKRMEFSLSATWSRQTSVRHVLLLRHRAAGKSSYRGKMIQNWKDDPYLQLSLLRNEMHHLISNINYYVMFEVLESAWQDLERNFSNANDLDQLVTAHNNYLSAVIDKALLGPDSVELRNVLNELFFLIIRLHNIVNQTSSKLIESYEVAEQARLESLENQTLAKWKTISLSSSSLPTSVSTSSISSSSSSSSTSTITTSATVSLPLNIKTNINIISKEWQQLLTKFKTILEGKDHLRFLLLRLNFGETKKKF